MYALDANIIHEKDRQTIQEKLQDREEEKRQKTENSRTFYNKNRKTENQMYVYDRNEKTCRYFNNGYCYNGIYCRYKHQENYKDANTKRNMIDKECRDFKNGWCRFGNNCKYSHKIETKKDPQNNPEYRNTQYRQSKGQERYTNQGYDEINNNYIKRKDQEKDNFCRYYKKAEECPYSLRGCKFICYQNRGYQNMTNEEEQKDRERKEMKNDIAFLGKQMQEVLGIIGKVNRTAMQENIHVNLKNLRNQGNMEENYRY